MKNLINFVVNYCHKGKMTQNVLLFLVTFAMLLGNTVTNLKLYFTKVQTAAAGIPFGLLLFVTPITDSLERHLVSFAKKQGVDLNTDLIKEVDHLHLVYHPRHRHQYKGKAVKGTYYIIKSKTKSKNKK